MAGRMVAAVSESFDWREMGSGFFPISRNHFSFSGRDVLLQHGADAEAPTFSASNHWLALIRRRPSRDWVDLVHPRCPRAGAGYLLVLDESCWLHVPLHL